MEQTTINSIPHIEEIHAQHGEFSGVFPQATHTFSERMLTMNKILPSIEEAIKRVGLKDGMTISFHHHFRNGDYITNMVMDVIARMGFKDLTVAASSLNDVHAPLIKHIENGVIKHIETSGMRGELADRISHGLMDFPVVFRSHGGRAAAIESGEITIDVAFLGAPSCDPYGNANGYSREQDNAASCGSLGYAKLDASHARNTIILTDHIVRFPNAPFGIPESNVTYVVKVDAIGDAQGIMSGATRFTKNPKELLIAKQAAEVIEASGYFYDGFSMQMGSGGASLATARFLREKMERNNIKCRFALGGITGQIVDMHEHGLIERILDVQSFDLIAAESLKNNRFHQQIDASYYASYINKGAAVNQLDFVVLSALEIDVNFNVNVLTGSDGVIRGAIGGHPDTADGASLAVVVAPLTRGRIPTVVKKVNTVVTPGAIIDVLVTDQGIAVNPLRPEIRERLIKAGLPIFSIEQLEERAERIVGTPQPIQYHDRIVGVVMYRDNTIIDVIRQVKDPDEF
ncbi:MAG: citrate lyase subunit alpha [Clostridia bacterium]|nr:citrate lyase subunit alpha [Clostridia bacterium]